MNVSATMDGNVVNIVGMNQSGNDVYIVYVNTAAELRATKKTRNILTSAGTLIGTAATVN